MRRKSSAPSSSLRSCARQLSACSAATIADAIASEVQYLRFRPAFQQSRQRAHEDVEAAIGFEVAGAVSDDLVRPRQTAAPAQPQARRTVRLHHCGVDPLMHDRDTVAMRLRILRALPLRRALAAIVRVETEEIQRIAGAQPHRGVPVGWEFAVEIDVRTSQSVEEFEIAEQWDTRPDVLDVEDLAPAVVPDDEVRHKAVARQPLA